MFKILQKTFRTGVVTADYPQSPAQVSGNFRGRPSFNFEQWRDARPAAEACPTGAIAISDRGSSREVTVDYGRCIFCGQCADRDVRMTREFELAVRDRSELVATAVYELNADATHHRLVRESGAQREKQVSAKIRAIRSQ